MYLAERRHEFNSMKSIQRRLSVGLISVLIIIGLLLVQTSSWLFEAGLRRYFENHLHLESENLLAALVRGPQGIELDQSRISSAYKRPLDRKSTRLNSSHVKISYAVFCLKKKTRLTRRTKV